MLAAFWGLQLRTYTVIMCVGGWGVVGTEKNVFNLREHRDCLLSIQFSGIVNQLISPDRLAGGRRGFRYSYTEFLLFRELIQYIL